MYDRFGPVHESKPFSWGPEMCNLDIEFYGFLKKRVVSFYSVSAEVRNILNIICIDTLWPFWPCPRAKTPSHKRVIKFIIFLEDCTVYFSI